jgi:Tol biopolymer transport system component
MRQPIDPFNRAAFALIALLLAAIGLALLAGDRVGIRVLRTLPQDLSSAGALVQISFSEPLDPASTEGKISLEPPVAGTTSVRGNTLIFQPAQPLLTGQGYTVRVAAGVRAAGGRALLQSQQWQFRVRGAQVAYLAPADSLTQNLFLLDPTLPGQPSQLTNYVTGGVIGFDVSNDGSKIAYAAFTEMRTVNLHLYDLTSNANTLLLECLDAQCANPLWSPDGQMLAFERVELNSGGGGVPGAPRIWLKNLANNSLRPLFSDSQRVGYSPQWSPDSQWLASYDANITGIVIVNLADGRERTIRALQGELGAFSPDGRWLTYPKIVDNRETGRSVAHITLVDLSTELAVESDLTPANDPNNDTEHLWLADSQGLILARRTPNPNQVMGAQLYKMLLSDRVAIPLVVDATYSNGRLALSPNGGQLAFQRIALGRQGARPEVWLYDLTTSELRLLAENAIAPQWIP